MRTIRPLIALIVGLTLLTPVTRAEDALDLTPKWPVGNVFSFDEKTETSQTISSPMMPMPMEQKMEQEQSYSISVLEETPEGGRKMLLTFTAFKIRMDMPGLAEPMIFDSSATDEEQGVNPMLQAYKHIAGMEITVFTDRDGKVLKVEGAREAMAQIMGDAGSDPAMLEQMFSEDSLKMMYEYMFRQGIPQHPVREGESWTEVTPIPMGEIGEITIDLNSTFTGMETKAGRDCAKVAYTGTMSGEIGGEEGQMMGVKMKLHDGVITGTSYVYPKYGMSISSTMTTEAQADIEAPGPQGPITSSMTLSQKRVIHMTRVSKVDAATE